MCLFCQVPPGVASDLRSALMNSDENSSEIREMTPATLRRFLRLNAHIAPAASSSTSSRPRSVNSSRGDRSLSGSSNSSGGASSKTVASAVAEVPGLALQLLEFCLLDCYPPQPNANPSTLHENAGAQVSGSDGSMAAVAVAADDGDDDGNNARATPSVAVEARYADGGGSNTGADGDNGVVAQMDAATLARKWNELAGCPLLPLASGGVGIFFATSNSQASSSRAQQQQPPPFVFANRRQQSLLPCLAARFVAPSAAIKLAPWLNQPAFREAVGIAPFTAEVLAQHLPEQLPAHWRGAQAVVWNPHAKAAVNHDQRTDNGSTSGSSSSSGHTRSPPSALWLATLWQEVDLAAPETLTVLRDWPLLPVHAPHLATSTASASSSPSSASAATTSTTAAGASVSPVVLPGEEGGSSSGTRNASSAASGPGESSLQPLLVSCSLADVVLRSPGAMHIQLRTKLRTAEARARAAVAAETRAEEAASARAAAADDAHRANLGWSTQIERPALPAVVAAAGATATASTGGATDSNSNTNRNNNSSDSGGAETSAAISLPSPPPQPQDINQRQDSEPDDDDEVDLDALPSVPAAATAVAAAASTSTGAEADTAAAGAATATGAPSTAAATAADDDNDDGENEGVAPAVLPLLLQVGLPVLELAYLSGRTLTSPGFLASTPQDLSRNALHALATLTMQQHSYAASSNSSDSVSGSNQRNTFLGSLGRDIGRAARAAHGGFLAGMNNSSTGNNSQNSLASSTTSVGSELLHLDWSRLEPEALDALLSLFARPDGRQAAVLTPSLSDKLKHLPLFETLAAGVRVALLPVPRPALQASTAAPSSSGNLTGSAGGSGGSANNTLTGERSDQNYYYTLDEGHTGSSSSSSIGASGSAAAGGVPLPLAARARFLVARERWVRDLYRDLGVPSLDNAGVLTRFLLPEFGHLAPGDQEALLAFVCAQWPALKEADAEFVTTLANVPFLPKPRATTTSMTAGAAAGGGGEGSDLSVEEGASGGDGNSTANNGNSSEPSPFARARELLDPSHPLLAHVFDDAPHAFPPCGAPFYFGSLDGPWLPILRELGLPPKVDRDALLRCAKHVEESYLQQVLKQALALSRVVQKNEKCHEMNNTRFKEISNSLSS